VPFSRTEPNVPEWEEDPNSPVSDASGSVSSIQVTLADTYDVVRVVAKGDYSGDFANLQIQVNGDTGTNYNARDTDGGETRGVSFWPIATLTDTGPNTVVGSCHISGRFQEQCAVCNVPGAARASSFPTQHGDNTNVTGPLDSVTVRYPFGADSGVVEVYGRDIA